jgi:molybdopterin-guanine dinucleotide biosynthesis protein MobB
VISQLIGGLISAAHRMCDFNSASIPLLRTPMPSPPRIHIIGRKNAGKTTLVCELLRELNSRGLRVASVKHTHHRHELDTPGKDSHRHRESGAAAVGILSPQMTALFIPADRASQSDADRYQAFESAFQNCQLILVEGDQHTAAPKIEVWRQACGQPPIAADDSAVIALITDSQPTAGVNCRVLPRNPLDAVLNLILKQVPNADLFLPS